MLHTLTSPSLAPEASSCPSHDSDKSLTSVVCPRHDTISRPVCTLQICTHAHAARQQQWLRAVKCALSEQKPHRSASRQKTARGACCSNGRLLPLLLLLPQVLLLLSCLEDAVISPGDDPGGLLVKQHTEDRKAMASEGCMVAEACRHRAQRQPAAAAGAAGAQAGLPQEQLLRQGGGVLGPSQPQRDLAVCWELLQGRQCGKGAFREQRADPLHTAQRGTAPGSRHASCIARHCMGAKTWKVHSPRLLRSCCSARAAATASAAPAATRAAACRAAASAAGMAWADSSLQASTHVHACLSLPQH